MNCSLLLNSSQCEYCNTTAHCQSGLCRHFQGHSQPGWPEDVLGLCHSQSGRGNVFPKDPLGRIISFGLLGIVVSVVSFIFLRLFASACSWKKLCVCQCSVSVQCCCEPKLPRLRVIPATGEPRLSREQLEPSPPPSYLDIYPEPASSSQEQADSNLLNPNTRPVFTADIRWVEFFFFGQELADLVSAGVRTKKFTFLYLNLNTVLL